MEHMFNPIRSSRNIKNIKIETDKLNSLTGLNILDIGCGGGLISDLWQD